MKYALAIFVCVFVFKVNAWQDCINATRFVMMPQKSQELCLRYIEHRLKAENRTKLPRPEEMAAIDNKLSGLDPDLQDVLKIIGARHMPYLYKKLFKPDGKGYMIDHQDLKRYNFKLSGRHVYVSIIARITLSKEQRTKIGNGQLHTTFEYATYEYCNRCKAVALSISEANSRWEMVPISFKRLIDKPPSRDPGMVFALYQENKCYVVLNAADDIINGSLGTTPWIPDIPLCFGENSPKVELWLSIFSLTPYRPQGSLEYLQFKNGQPKFKGVRCDLDDDDNAIVPEGSCCIFQDKPSETDPFSYSCRGKCPHNQGGNKCCVMQYPNPYYYTHHDHYEAKVFEIPNFRRKMFCQCQRV